jgi:hypothetical protein
MSEIGIKPSGNFASPDSAKKTTATINDITVQQSGLNADRTILSGNLIPCDKRFSSFENINLNNNKILAKQPETLSSANFNNDILFIGLNSEANIEVDALNKNISKDAKVYFVHQAETGADTFKDTDGNVYDLNNDEDINKFVGKLDLEPAKANEVIEFIKQPVKNSIFGGLANNIKDELAQIIKVWAKSEKGEEVPSRLILSGHSVGDGITGESNGTLSINIIQNLAKLFPKAANSIEDLHISGCSSGGEITVETYREIFPNLKSEWTYSHSAPSAKNGAVQHQKIWETATRDRNASLNRNIAIGTRLGENVNTWAIETGFKDGKPVKNINDLLSSLDDQTALFARFYMGYEPVKNSHSGPLRSYYELVQDILQSKQSKDLPEEKRISLEKMRDKAIRLLYYNQSIAPNFQKNFSAEIKIGYQSIGKEPPDFSKLSRAEAILEITDFDNNIGQNEDAPESAKELLKLLKSGLKDLSREIVPDGWLG